MKPRCTGTKTSGHWTGFECVLDDGHDGFCEPYQAPTVDEWRVMSAERDALKRRAENASAEMTRQKLLTTVATLKAQKADAQAGAGRVAIRMLMDDHDPDTYSRCQDRECDHVRLALAALGDDAGRDMIQSLRAAEVERDALRRVDAMRAHGVAKWKLKAARLQSELDRARQITADAMAGADGHLANLQAVCNGLRADLAKAEGERDAVVEQRAHEFEESNWVIERLRNERDRAVAISDDATRRVTAAEADAAVALGIGITAPGVVAVHRELDRLRRERDVAGSCARTAEMDSALWQHCAMSQTAELARLLAELDALRAILASGCDACAHAAPKHPVSQEATLAEMRGALDDDAPERTDP